MTGEITRASNDDRERYLAHLSNLYAQGYVTDDELPRMRDRILAARELATLRQPHRGLTANLSEATGFITGLADLIISIVIWEDLGRRTQEEILSGRSSCRS